MDQIGDYLPRQGNDTLKDLVSNPTHRLRSLAANSGATAEPLGLCSQEKCPKREVPQPFFVRHRGFLYSVERELIAENL